MKTIQKDITKNASGLIIHGTNCRGRMGSGVAKAIRDRWPIVYEEFVKNGTGPELLGTFQPVEINKDLVVGNCYTQEYYGNDGSKYADLDAIHSSLTAACEYAKKHNLILKSPLIGCGLGGLTVSQVMPIYHELDERFEIEIELYFI